MTQKRIAFALYSLQGGGAERMVSRLANAFVALGLQVDIVLLDGAMHIDYNLDRRVEIIDCGFPLLKGKIRRRIKTIFAIRDYIINNHPNVVFCYLFTTLPFFILANLGLDCSCKIVGSQRTNPKAIQACYRAVVYPFLFCCDGFVFQTTKVMNYYPGWLQEKSVVIGNIAPKMQKKERRQIIENAVCSAGRLHADKDYATLLRAFALVLHSVPNASLHIYGDGPLKEELQGIVAGLQISHQVVFEGFSKNLEDELTQYAIFAFSSKAEGLPNSLMEAMAAGLACVATDCDYGPSELIEDGVNGYLVPVGDENKMAEKLIYLLQHEAKRVELQTEAKKIIYRFSEANIINAYLDYAKIVCERQ